MEPTTNLRNYIATALTGFIHGGLAFRTSGRIVLINCIAISLDPIRASHSAAINNSLRTFKNFERIYP